MFESPAGQVGKGRDKEQVVAREQSHGQSMWENLKEEFGVKFRQMATKKWKGTYTQSSNTSEMVRGS